MATLKSLKGILKLRVSPSSPTQLLSDEQYSAGLDTLLRGPGCMTYQEFIIPQLSQLLAPLFDSGIDISVLEIGPGPESVLGYLPTRLRRKIRRYVAFQPNDILATKLEEWLSSTSEPEPPLPGLKTPPDIHRIPFDQDINTKSGTGTGTRDSDEKFAVVLFCHSMYGMKLQFRPIEQALEMLDQRYEGAMVAVFHRDEAMHLEGLVCHRRGSFPAGVVSVVNEDETLDAFASFIAGFVMQDVEADKAVRVEWRKTCRTLARYEDSDPDHLLFRSPSMMVAFTRHATTLPELTVHVPVLEGEKKVKNLEASLHHPASIVRPTEVRHIQRCVKWALEHGVNLTVIGGGHSGHCLRSNVVSIDMSAFDEIYIVTDGDGGRESNSDSFPLVIAGAGCKTRDIVRKSMAAGVTVPSGTRPSIGAGLWLQGGIGHLARMHGLACDAIVGAVIVSVDSGQVFNIGRVPSQHKPVGAVRPENEYELLWGMKGAGTNFGIVVSVIFKAYAAPTFFIRNWVIEPRDTIDARRRLEKFGNISTELPQNCSTDAYMYWDNEEQKIKIRVTLFEASATGLSSHRLDKNVQTVDGVGLFEAEMYMSRMHAGQGYTETSSFKRCLFFKRIGAPDVTGILAAAVEDRPSKLSYLHLVQGGGAIGDVAADATAFGCRDWDFACVITAVWDRADDGTGSALAAVQWVYDVARDLLPVSTGVYGADLGPDPRDAALASKAFGPNQARLARLKNSLDPHNVLAYACPLMKAPREQRLIILVTGASGAGKNYCADAWMSVFLNCTHKSLTARVVDISDATKREYATAFGADLNRLLGDRVYKEKHRPALTTFFLKQVQGRGWLPEEHFLNVVNGARDVDVLLITGMRDQAPVAAFSHLVSDSRLLEIHVTASEDTRRARRGYPKGDHDTLKPVAHRPSLVFDNDATGNKAAKRLAKDHLLPFFDEDLHRLANMVQLAPDFPRASVNFRHVLNISQQPGGLALCTSLLRTHFIGDWAKVRAIVCCENGGFIFASALASQVDVPLALIREAGKLPPPTVCVLKPPSHISLKSSSNEKCIEMERDLIPRGASVVVVDDVFASAKTLCAVLQLLKEVDVADVSIMVVSEFPVHRGRQLLRQHGFNVNIQSLLIFDGA